MSPIGLSPTHAHESQFVLSLYLFTPSSLPCRFQTAASDMKTTDLERLFNSSHNWVRSNPCNKSFLVVLHVKLDLTEARCPQLMESLLRVVPGILRMVHPLLDPRSLTFHSLINYHHLRLPYSGIIFIFSVKVCFYNFYYCLIIKEQLVFLECSLSSGFQAVGRKQ